MRSSAFHLRLPAKGWVWGPTAYWKIYSSMRKSFPFLKRGASISSFGKVPKTKFDQEEFSKLSKETKSTAKRIIQASYHGSCLVSHGRYSSFIDAVLSRESGRRNGEKRGINQRLRKYLSSEDDRVQLSTSEINKILRAHEYTKSINLELVSQINFNHLASNKPTEDQSFAVRPNHNGGLLVGIIDGHGGAMFAETVQKRLPLYISAAIANDEALSVMSDSFDPAFLAQNIFQDHISDGDSSNKNLWHSKLESYLRESLNAQRAHESDNMLDIVRTPLRHILGTSIMGAYPDLDTVTDVTNCLKDAFLRLDMDIANEVIELSTKGLLCKDNIGLATSGCCALVAYVKDEDLHLANSGDCRAVLGNYSNDRWSAVPLTNDHTVVANPEEVQRILSEHPHDEARSCIQYGRLLGRLAPLRALGDLPFKLDADLQRTMLQQPIPNFQPMSGLKTPPYLTAEPEVFRYKLQKEDKFVVLASDGLWDMLSNQEVVSLVGAWMNGQTVSSMKERAVISCIPDLDDVLAAIDDDSDVANDNVATYLVRCALGGYDYYSLSTMLTLPHPEVRMYRDDISIAVIFFDQEIGFHGEDQDV